MKKYSELTPKEVALRYIYSRDNIGRFQRKPKFDRRTNFGKEVHRLIIELQISESEKWEIVKKRKARNDAKRIGNPLPNWINRPIYIDAEKHPKDIRWINSDHINFAHGRNHWAKDETDRKILAVLSKHQSKKQAA